MNDYTGEQLHEYFLQAPPEVQKILLSDDLETTSTVLGKLYKLPIDKFLTLKNIITLILLGIIKPESVVDELQKQISLENDTASSLAKDLNDSILQEARMMISGDDKDEIKVLQIKNTIPSKDLLREEIMSRTKQESAINKIPNEIPATSEENKSTPYVVASSHDQLLEQLQVIETLPKDDEVEERLSKIRAQVDDIKKKTLADQEKESIEDEKEKVEAVVQAAIPRKQVFPTSYEIDPYREMATV